MKIREIRGLKTFENDERKTKIGTRFRNTLYLHFSNPGQTQSNAGIDFCIL